MHNGRSGRRKTTSDENRMYVLSKNQEFLLIFSQMS